MDHNKVIAATAKRKLAPHGLRRDGKSRIWYDDHGWWAIVVEFQPSSWSRGSYLNVGLSWFLYENGGWTFDIGYRESDFASADRDAQFESAIEKIADHALRRAFDIRDQFGTLTAMREYYGVKGPSECWPGYYAGVLAALDSDWAAAEDCFRRVAASPCSVSWHHARRFRCLEFLRALGHRDWIHEMTMGIVMRSRSGRCLDEMPIPEIALPG